MPNNASFLRIKYQKTSPSTLGRTSAKESTPFSEDHFISSGTLSILRRVSLPPPHGHGRTRRTRRTRALQPRLVSQSRRLPGKRCLRLLDPSREPKSRGASELMAFLCFTRELEVKATIGGPSRKTDGCCWYMVHKALLSQ